MKSLYLLVACAALAACEGGTTPMASRQTTAGEIFQPPPAGKGALYVVAGDIPDRPTISVGASTAGTLTKNRWLRLDLTPGSYDLEARSAYSESKLSLTIAANTSTFVQLQFIDSRPWRDVLSKISEADGRALTSAAIRVEP